MTNGTPEPWNPTTRDDFVDAFADALAKNDARRQAEAEAAAQAKRQADEAAGKNTPDTPPRDNSLAARLLGIRTGDGK